MARALQLARRGLNGTAPNPRVGCVLVKEGRIIGTGWHRRAGEAHAEINALLDCSEDPAGSTCYVTLEPCSHTGRTPPCSTALIKAGVGSVIAAMADPNPAVAGEGLRRLQAAGIETSAGLLESQAEALNPGFCKRMRSGIPWVRAKLAISLDGRTALAGGESRWITGAAARQDVHRLRARSCAILTGIGTVLMDDPQLTARSEGEPAGRQPLRVVLDSRLQLPADAAVLGQPGRTLVLTTPAAPEKEKSALQENGAEVVVLAGATHAERLRQALHLLATEYEINEIMVEAGARLNGSLLRAGLVDELVVYMAPLLLGHEARPLFELAGIEGMHERLSLQLLNVRQVGQDLRLVYRPLATG